MHSRAKNPARILLGGVYLAVAFGLPVSAQEPSAPADDFAACVEGLAARARAEGVPDSVVTDVLGSLEPSERVIELDRRQPEFTQTFADYYFRRVTEDRVERGRELLARHRELLDGVQRRYGIPPHYLVAFWSLETNFGDYFGNMPVAQSLATLACDPRRSGFFADELMAALRIVAAGDVSYERMVGSWAGAMGHMQFLPTAFLKHAVDADGDGRRDLWGSIEDAMHSAGRFLDALGWESGLRWGREVTLPDGFDFSLAGRDRQEPLSFWVERGVRDAYGRVLPALDLPASILVPAGHRGPAFIVYANFDVIMRWNRSEHYALAVGRMADRLAGAAELVRPPRQDEARVTREDVQGLQTALARLGYDPGDADGIFGPATRRALARFQRDRELIADGHLDPDAISAVREAAGDGG